MSASILVIEDNPDNRKLVTWILEDENYQVTCAESAEEGLTLVEQATFDLILMDISLPGIDGTEATRLIRQMPNLKHIPIIALTAHAIKGEQESILACGVDDLITKPLDEDQLLSRMQELLKRKN
jgi:two-component system, cell cycle response regulator DivK